MAGFGPGNILIKIGATGTEAIAEIERVNASMGTTATRSERMGAALKKAAIPAAIALGAIAVGAKKAIDAAADLEKQQEKTNKLFGASADAVDKWSRGLAESFGLSSAEALTAANRFGNMFENLGYGTKESAKMSEQMVQLAADLASFNNVPVDATLQALQQGIGGATRGLKKFGIIIDANALKQKALAMGLWDGKGAMDAHAKSAATMALILEQTSKAQGDFAKHSSDAANAQKVQAAETKNLEENLGKGLLPAYEASLKILVSLTKTMGDHTTAVKIAVGVIGGFSAAILLANAAMKAYAAGQVIVKAATVAWTAAQRGLDLALAANPIGLVIVAVVALGAALVVAYQHSATFRRIVSDALDAVHSAANALVRGFNAVRDAAVSAFNWIVDHWRLGAFAFGPLGAALLTLVDHFQAIRGAALGTFNAIANAIGSVIAAVKDLIGWLGKIHVPHISLPHIPGLKLAAASPLAYYSSPFDARARAGGAPRAVVAGGDGAGMVVNFYGPTDPEGAARAIARVLRSHERRQGRRVV